MNLPLDESHRIADEAIEAYGALSFEEMSEITALGAVLMYANALQAAADSLYMTTDPNAWIEAEQKATEKHEEYHTKSIAFHRTCELKRRQGFRPHDVVTGKCQQCYPAGTASYSLFINQEIDDENVSDSDALQVMEWIAADPRNATEVLKELKEITVRHYFRGEPIIVAAWRAMPYDLYRMSDHWQRVSAKIRNKWAACSFCKTSLHLNAHHRSYRHLGFEWWSCLEPFCKRCHNVGHEHSGRMGVVR